MCSNYPIIGLIPLEQPNCALLRPYGTYVYSYIYAILYGMRVEYTAKTYQHGIPFMVYGVSTGNQ